MIKVGDAIPSMKLTAATPDGPKEITTEEIFGDGRAVLFAVPGAFTPTCSQRHLPGFLQHIETLTAKGVRHVACISVNDPFVMGAWAKDQEVDGRIIMLADGSGAFTKALGLELDMTARGLGIRSARYAMVTDNGKVTNLAVEEPGSFEVSKAESVIETLGAL